MAIAQITDPCLSYEDSISKLRCAECDTGYVRISAEDQVYCGTTNYFSDNTDLSCSLFTYTDRTISAYVQSLSFQIQNYSSYGEQAFICYSCSDYGCSSCGKIPLSQVDSRTKISLDQYSIGCTSCLTNYSSFINMTNGITPVFRQCLNTSTNPANPQNCSLNQYFQIAIPAKSSKCTNCSSQYQNCAICNQSQCLVCLDDYYFGNWTNASGQVQKRCVYRTCNLGFGPNLGLGHSQCIPCQTKNCSSCEFNSSSLTETCILCDSTTYLLFDSATNTSSCKPKTSTQSQVKMFVVPQPAYVSDVNTTYLNLPLTGLTLDFAFPFITQALKAVEGIAITQNITVNATIYLSKGSHFFFWCDSQTYIPGTSDKTDKYYDYCTQFSSNLTPAKFSVNNINFTVQPLNCALETSLASFYSNKSYFKSLCLTNNALIYVNHPRFYFNVTNSFTFVNVNFSGINAFAKAASSNINLQFFPKKFCNQSSQSVTSNLHLSLSLLPAGTEDFSYSCLDPFYSGSSIPQKSGLNYSCSDAYPSEKKSTGGCSGEIDREDFFQSQLNDGRHESRRKTLFNLYAFNTYNSFQSKVIVPALTLSQCNFEYLMYDYESLITIETNNLFYSPKRDTSIDPNQYYSYQGADYGAKIIIIGSNLQNSRFCKGLIVYRKAPVILDTSFVFNYTQYFNGSSTTARGDNYISLINSVFTNLNYATNQTSAQARILEGQALMNYVYSSYAQQSPLMYPGFINKGIILNLEDFPGQVEISGCTITRNSIFIPEVYFGNHSVLASTPQLIDKSYFLNRLTSEYQFSTCNYSSMTNSYFLTSSISQSDNTELLFDSLERLSAVYISRPSKPILILQTVFQDNIGVFGGAVTINSPNYQNGQYPYLIVQGSTFRRNMAYLSGNAIFVRQTRPASRNLDYVCGGVKLDGSDFLNNNGLKKSSGGAVTHICQFIENQLHEDINATSEYIFYDRSKSIEDENQMDTVQTYNIPGNNFVTIFKNQASINNCKFSQNYAGFRGSALFLKGLSKIIIRESTLENNGPILSFYEQDFSPYYKLFGGRLATFQSESSDCDDEFSFLNGCRNLNRDLEWPQIQGALFVSNCEESKCLEAPEFKQILYVFETVFDGNNALPLLSKESKLDTSSSIYLEGGFSTQFSHCQFINHNGIYGALLQNNAPLLHSYMPSYYFNYAQSPVILISIAPQSYSSDQSQFISIFDSCSFKNNKHIQNLGFDKSADYFGSLVQIRTTQFPQLIGNGVIPVGVIQSLLVMRLNSIENNFFIGRNSSLIYVEETLMQFENNTIENNGYISQVENSKTSFESVSTGINLPFSSYSLKKYQEFGVLWINSRLLQQSNKSHKISSNNISYSYANEGSVFYFSIQNQFLILASNIYQKNFALNSGSVLSVNSHNLETSPLFYSVISIQNETFIDCFALEMGGCISVKENMKQTNIFISRSKFVNSKANQGAAIYSKNSQRIHISNSSFSSLLPLNTGIKILTKTEKQLQLQFIGQTNIDNQTAKLFTNSNLPDKIGHLYFEADQSLTSIQDLYFNSLLILNSSSAYSSMNQISHTSFTSVSGSTGGAIYSSNERLYLKNVSIQNSSVSNGNIFIQNNSTFLAYDLQMSNNNATSFGSGLSCITKSNCSLINSTFSKNYAGQQGTIMINDNSHFKCRNCSFDSNHAQGGSVMLLAQNNQQSLIEVIESRAVNNTSGQNLASFVSSNVKFENSEFIDNVAEAISHGITLFSSSFQGSNITFDFTNQEFLDLPTTGTGIDAGTFNLLYQSELVLDQNSKINNCRGELVSGISAQSQSSIKLDNVQISNCYSDSGKLIHCLNSQNSSFTNLISTNNNQYTGIQLDGGTSSFDGCIFDQIWYVMIYMIGGAEAEFNNVTMRNGSFLTQNGIGILSYSKSLVVNNSHFENLSGAQGGAIYIFGDTSSGYVRLENSVFKNNYAQQGGAIYVATVNVMDIINTQFIGNKALLINPATSATAYLISKGQGGALYLGCITDSTLPTPTSAQCQINLQNNSVFQDNWSSNDGGAYIWTNQAPIEVDSSTLYINNQANYGKISASYPTTMVCTFISNGDYLSESVYNDWQIVSGTEFSFNITIYDQSGNVYLTDNESLAKMSLANASQANSTSISNLQMQAQNGVYYFKQVIIVGTPGSHIPVNLKFLNLADKTNRVKLIVKNNGTETVFSNQSDFILTFKLRPCIQGEYLTLDGKCIICPTGSYLYLAPVFPINCSYCPNNAICFSGSKVAPQAQYWRSSNVSEDYIRCQIDDSCLEGDIDHPMGICKEGYEGIICGECQKGYYKSDQFACSKCPSKGSSFALVLFCIIGFLSFTALIMNSSIMSSSKKNPSYTVYLKLLVNHSQMLGLLSNVNFRLPFQLLFMFKAQAFFYKMVQVSFSFDCLLQEYQISVYGLRTYYITLIVFFCIPIAFSCLTLLYWVLHSLVIQNFSLLIDNFMTSVVTIIFLLYPNVCFMLFSCFDCIEIDGVLRLRQDVDIICYQDFHLKILLCLALPGVLIFGMGIIGLILYILRQNKLVIKHIETRSVQSLSDRFLIKQIKMKYGFLIYGYKFEHFLWEVSIMVRKLLLVINAVFSSRISTEFQALTQLFIIILSLVLQLWFKPYKFELINRMETFSLAVTLLSLYIGLFYLFCFTNEQDVSKWISWIIFMVLFLPCVFFAGYWGYQVRVQLLKIFIKNKRHFLFKVFSCLLLKEFEFTNKYKKDRRKIYEIEGDPNVHSEDNQVKELSNKVHLRSDSSMGGVKNLKDLEKMEESDQSSSTPSKQSRGGMKQIQTRKENPFMSKTKRYADVLFENTDERRESDLQNTSVINADKSYSQNYGNMVSHHMINLDLSNIPSERKKFGRIMPEPQAKVLTSSNDMTIQSMDTKLSYFMRDKGKPKNAKVFPDKPPSIPVVQSLHTEDSLVNPSNQSPRRSGIARRAKLEGRYGLKSADFQAKQGSEKREGQVTPQKEKGRVNEGRKQKKNQVSQILSSAAHDLSFENSNIISPQVNLNEFQNEYPSNRVLIKQDGNQKVIGGNNLRVEKHLF